MSAATITPPKVQRTIKRSTIRRSSEFDSRSLTPPALPSKEIPSLVQSITADPDVLKVEQLPKQHQLQELAFGEEPVRILIHRSGEKNPPQTTELIAVNGKKAEMLFKNGWVEIGYLPRGYAFYTKRKYVEQIAHTISISVRTRVVEDFNEESGPARWKNYADRDAAQVFPFSIVEDKSPRAAEWIERLMLQHG